MALSTAEYELITFMEMDYHLTGIIPTPEVCVTELGITDAFYVKCVKNPQFQRALANRGMSLSTNTRKRMVTAEQMMVINTLLDKNDSRSDKKKLTDLGIKSQTYQGWLKDPIFNDYVTQRCEALFPGMINDSHRALGNRARAGDLAAIKLVYEMTGRFVPKSSADFSIDTVLMRVMEIIQRNVTDSNTLMAIASEFKELAPASKQHQLPTLMPVIDHEELGSPETIYEPNSIPQHSAPPLPHTSHQDDPGSTVQNPLSAAAGLALPDFDPSTLPSGGLNSLDTL